MIGANCKGRRGRCSVQLRHVLRTSIQYGPADPGCAGRPSHLGQRGAAHWFQHNRVRPGLGTILDGLQNLCTLIDGIVVGESDFGMDATLVRGLFCGRGLGYLEIVILRMERNEEFEFFHHAPKLTLVALTIRTARGEVLGFSGSIPVRVNGSLDVLAQDNHRHMNQFARSLQPSMDPTGRLATGQCAFRSTRSAVLPRRASRNPSGPSVVMTMRSARSSEAVCRIVSAGSPTLATLFQVQPVSLGSCIEGISAAGPTWSNVT